jgi:hypothetical protein
LIDVFVLFSFRFTKGLVVAPRISFILLLNTASATGCPGVWLQGVLCDRAAVLQDAAKTLAEDLNTPENFLLHRPTYHNHHIIRHSFYSEDDKT